MNKLATFTAALIASYGAAIASGQVAPNKYTGYAFIVGAAVQASQKPAVKKKPKA